MKQWYCQKGTEEEKIKHTLKSKLQSAPTRRPVSMDAVSSLPVIQIDHLAHRPIGNNHRHQHISSLRLNILQPHQTMCGSRQCHSDSRIEKSDGKTLRSQLHSGTLIEKNRFSRIIPIRNEHRHLPDDVVHCAGNTEEVDEDREAHP